MNPSKSFSNAGAVNRRGFLKAGSALTAAAALPSFSTRAATNKNSKLRILQIGVGGIGGLQRRGLKDHPKVEWFGFCDVDQSILVKETEAYKGVKHFTDYRVAFEKHVDEFDAVIVDTPDHHHAPMMLTAMKHGKHIYGQKPLVHQLDELRMIREGLGARPDLVTQMGNQRACYEGRMQAVEILRNNVLGRPVEAHVVTGGFSKGKYFADPWQDLPMGGKAPGHLNWDLWVGPVTRKLDYTEDLAPRRWRSFWDTGGGMLGDWGCHLIDLLYFAYDLPAPEAVQTNTSRPSNDSHTAYNASTITYAGGDRFARDKFVMHYTDFGIQPPFAALGLPPMNIGSNKTLVVCEEGVLILEPGGKYQTFRNGKEVKLDRPKVGKRDHWKDWADNCLGAEKPLWTPFDIGSRITEPALLAVKATRFPNKELRWDGKNYRFTNNEEANKTILKREYRKGFAPPAVS